MNIKLIILGALISTSCSNINKNSNSIIATFKDDKQIPLIDSSLKDINIQATDTIIGGQSFDAKIWLINNNYTIVKAYANCDFNSSLIDTLNKTLDNCNIKIFTDNDTAFFSFIPMGSAETNQIHKLALLTIDENKIYSLKTCNLKVHILKRP